MTINLTELTRKEKFSLWLKRNRRTYAELARSMGMTLWGAANLFNRQSIPTLRHDQLLELGIPSEFLPPAKDIPRGRKPRRGQSGA